MAGFIVRCRNLARPLVIVGALCAAQEAASQGFWDRTNLVTISDDSDLSSFVRKSGKVGVAKSDGSSLDISGWYRSDWRDLSLTWMTEISSNLGVYWGFSTGERGEKYTIDPSLRLGFIYNHPVAENAIISLSSMYVVGGSLSEDSCVADYGPVFGSFTVNCRLASSALPPSETLNYMLDRPRPNQFKLSLRYVLQF